MDAGEPPEVQRLLAALEAEVAAAEGRLRAERQEFTAAAQFVEELNQRQAHEAVTLDVGGECFRTAMANLCREESMLAVLVSGVFGDETDEDGAFFLDRDPSPFPLVLAYLRDPITAAAGGGGVGSLVIPERRAPRNALMREAVFYSLDSLTARLRAFQPALVPGCPFPFAGLDPTRYILSDGGRTVTTHRAGYGRVYGDLVLAEGRHRWRLSMTTAWVIVGIESPTATCRLIGPTGQVRTPCGSVVDHIPALRPHDVVTVEVELWAGGGTIAFAVNQGPPGPVVPITHSGPFRPSVVLYHVACSCSLLSYHRDRDD